MTRDEFRQSVFERDNHKCVICGESAQDAHHIMERRLWDDGGYHLNNGASLCSKHHIEAEQTTLSCEKIREAAGIDEVIIPSHLYDEFEYDKWGNIILPTGKRLKGALFFDKSVQKILDQGKVLDLFSKYIKYPRTLHLPWSPGLMNDDRQLESTEHFENREVVVTVKMDGENTSMYKDYLHARSIFGASHPSRGWVKNLHSKISYEIPEGWRFCGENLHPSGIS